MHLYRTYSCLNQLLFQIQEYYNRIESNKKLVEQEEQKRLEKIKKALNEQAENDRERIEYRNKLILEKKMELQSKKINKKLEEEEKEKKLEKFYESVKPKVQADPTRLISYTEVKYKVEYFDNKN